MRPPLEPQFTKQSTEVEMKSSGINAARLPPRKIQSAKYSGE